MLQPFNLQQWIANNSALLKPPVCNKAIYQDGDFILMVVGGPNERKDFHYNESCEIFYQIKGHMVLNIMQSRQIKSIRINEGEIFQLPPKIPHSPQRFSDTLGIVLEKKRAATEKDGLLWYCDHCVQPLYEEYFHLKNIETDLPPIFDRFNSSQKNKTCSFCNTVLEN